MTPRHTVRWKTLVFGIATLAATTLSAFSQPVEKWSATIPIPPNEESQSVLQIYADDHGGVLVVGSRGRSLYWINAQGQIIYQNTEVRDATIVEVQGGKAIVAAVDPDTSLPVTLAVTRHGNNVNTDIVPGYVSHEHAAGDDPLKRNSKPLNGNRVFTVQYFTPDEDPYTTVTKIVSYQLQ